MVLAANQRDLTGICQFERREEAAESASNYDYTWLSLLHASPGIIVVVRGDGNREAASCALSSSGRSPLPSFLLPLDSALNRMLNYGDF
jgi:hypothetical protein